MRRFPWGHVQVIASKVISPRRHENTKTISRKYQQFRENRTRPMLLVSWIRNQGITLRQCQVISWAKLETQTFFQQGTLWLIRNSSSVHHSPNKRLIRNTHPGSPYLRLHQDLIPTWGQRQYNFLGRHNIHTTKEQEQWYRLSKGCRRHNLQEKTAFRTTSSSEVHSRVKRPLVTNPSD